jgi:hypothetical protein
LGAVLAQEASVQGAREWARGSALASEASEVLALVQEASEVLAQVSASVGKGCWASS